MDAHDSNASARPGRPLRTLTLSVAALIAATAVAGCGGDPEGYNEADVAFASNMSQHHAQTVELVNLPLRHDVAHEDVGWTDEARTRRFHELKSFARMLRSWDQPVPETGLEHSDEGKHLVLDTRIPGILSPRRVRTLERATDGTFTQAWLEDMIRHEQGAVKMSEAEIADGQNAVAVEMAGKDKAAHAALVAELQRLADS